MRALFRDDSCQYVSKTVIEVYHKTSVVLKTVVKEITPVNRYSSSIPVINSVWRRHGLV